MRRLALPAALVALVTLGALSTVPAEAGEHHARAQITFARQLPGGGANVFITSPNGARVHRVPLVHPAEDFGLPIWSPRRTRLLISHVVRSDASGDLLPFRPAIVRPDGSGFRLLKPPKAPFDMGCTGGWYLDGSRVLCNFGGRHPGVFSIRSSDGGDPVRLTTYPFGSCNACDTPTDISPDGKRFVFLRFRREHTANREQVALFVKKLDGTGLRQVTPYGLATPFEIASAQWSPNGRQIISATPRGRLFVIHPDGTGFTRIHLRTGTRKYSAFEPDWSPDGKRIVFCMYVNGQEDIYTAHADGTHLTQVTDTRAAENGPDWGRSVHARTEG
jgi:Tol biopolymer transport system component